MGAAMVAWAPFKGLFIVRLLVRTVQEMSDDDATHMAAGVAYYAAFSLFPLMIGLIAIFNLLPTSEDREAQFIGFVAGYLPGSDGLLASDVRVSGTLGLISIVALLWSGSAMFGAVARVVNRAWDVQKDPPMFVGKPRQMVMALVVGLMFMTSMAAAAFVRTAGDYARADLPASDFLVSQASQWFLQGTSFALTLATFLMIYKLMPNTRTRWRYVWPGAVLAALLFEAAKGAFLTYVDRFANFRDVYGSMADALVLLLWLYVSSLILILGAELSSEYGRLREGRERGKVMRPSGGGR